MASTNFNFTKADFKEAIVKYLENQHVEEGEDEDDFKRPSDASLDRLYSKLQEFFPTEYFREQFEEAVTDAFANMEEERRAEEAMNTPDHSPKAD